MKPQAGVKGRLIKLQDIPDLRENWVSMNTLEGGCAFEQVLRRIVQVNACRRWQIWH